MSAATPLRVSDPSSADEEVTMVACERSDGSAELPKQGVLRLPPVERLRPAVIDEPELPSPRAGNFCWNCCRVRRGARYCMGTVGAEEELAAFPTQFQTC